MVEALDAGDVTKLGVGIIIALIVLGLIISLLITKLIVRVFVAVAVVVLVFVVWQQRTSIEHRIDQHKCNFDFLGVHLSPPDRLNRFCS
ncbi:MAG TPA: hypothetical protein VGH43_10375 [Jatrophihabitans sp.]